MNTKKFTILHSNDMHGDFIAETAQDKKELIGGLALLSGYINKVRHEEENVLYVVAGDMVQGSLIDTEFKGISTMEIMNYLAPDVVTLGNHEFDYGLPHLLFLEKMANFPIVNANLYIKQYHKRLMRPYIILKKAGLDILFTGIITDKVIDSIKQDKLIGSFVNLEEASVEVGKICNAYKNDDIDLTILLTHIGYDSDLELAKLLNPVWGVDMIIGGHTHTYLDKPANVNNILIAQAGAGTNQVGRFDIVVDDDTNSIVEYKWKLVEITNKLVHPDANLSKHIDLFQKSVNKKYHAILCKFSQPLTHPKREIETTLGNLIADAFAEVSQTEVMLVGSGSIRVKSMGPIVTMMDLMTCFPYDDVLKKFSIKGKYLKQLFNFILRNENRNNEGECYQINHQVQAVHDDKTNKLRSLFVNEKLVADEQTYSICMQGFHYNNCEAYLGVPPEKFQNEKVITTSAQQSLEEWLKSHQNMTKKIEGRLKFITI